MRAELVAGKRIERKEKFSSSSCASEAAPYGVACTAPSYHTIGACFVAGRVTVIEGPRFRLELEAFHILAPVTVVHHAR